MISKRDNADDDDDGLRRTVEAIVFASALGKSWVDGVPNANELTNADKYKTNNVLFLLLMALRALASTGMAWFEIYIQIP